MKVLNRSVTVVLLLFVGATVGMLIAQEVSHTDASPIESGQDIGTTVTAEPVAAAEEDSSASGSEGTGVESQAPGMEVSEVDVCVVDAIYFHNTLRCHTCKNIEETAKAVVEAEFSEEFASGRLRWSAINMERQQQYVEEFDLVKPTLILVRSVRGGQSEWTALDETWTLIRHEQGFADYVENATRSFLEGCP